MPTEEYFATNFRLEDEATLAALVRASSLRTVKQGQLLLRQGEQQHEIPFLVNGIIRGFYFDVNGREITDCFAMRPGTPLVAVADLKTPSPVYLEALEDSELLTIPLQDAFELLEQFPPLLQLYNQLLVNAFKTSWEIKTTLCRSTAMERYQWFLRMYPGLIERISNRCIASFLGMTPVTLSRLRRALREQNDQTI